MKIQALLIVVICVLSAFSCFNFVQAQEKRDRATQAGAPIEQIWDQADYEAFKQEAKRRWERFGWIHIDQHITDLIVFIDSLLKDPDYQEFYQRQALYAVNLLRDLLNLPLVKSIGPKEREWLQEVEQGVWKKNRQIEWEKAGIKELSKKIEDLIRDLDSYVGDPQKALGTFNHLRDLLGQPTVKFIGPKEEEWIQEVKQDVWKKEKQLEWENKGIKEQLKKIEDLMQYLSSYGLKNNPQQAFYAFNLIQELRGQPMVKSIGPKEKESIEKIRKDMKTIELVESKKDEFALPAITQKELVQEAQIITGLLDERAIVSRFGAKCSQRYIAVEQTVDLDEMLFGIYHELGHINYGDADLFGTKTHFEKYEEYQEGQSLQNFAQEHPKMNAQLDKMAEYVAKAKEKLNATSETGKILVEEIKKTSTFWNPPQDPKEYIDIAFGRSKESRADLFAVEQLLKQKRLDPILFTIRDWGTNYKHYSNYRIIEGNSDVHPSFLERVLYMAGYLFSKGVDVNNELKRWENFGICTDVRKMHGPWSRLHEKEMGDFERAYKSKEKELRELDYILWKSNKVEQLNASKSGQEELFHNVESLLTDLREIPENRSKQKETLFAYNYLRELNMQPVIESVNQISREWLKSIEKSIEYDNWEKAQVANWEWEAKNSTKTFFIGNLLRTIEIYENDQKRALFTYNYLRAFLGQPHGTSIDKNWLEAIKYSNWKDHVESVNKWSNFAERLHDLFVRSKNSQDSMRQKYAYDYLREIMGLPITSSIDEKWLADQKAYVDWLIDRNGLWEKNKITSLADKYKDLIQIIEPSGVIEWLKQQFGYSKEQLYAFNCLRMLLGKSVVDSIGQQEKDWLKQIQKQYN